MMNSMSDRWKKSETVLLPTEEYRNPIHAGMLSRVLLTILAAAKCSGIYHAGARDSISRFELGRQLALRLGMPLNLVRPFDTAIPGRAPRGKDHFLVTERLEGICNFDLGTCDDAIDRCFE